MAKIESESVRIIVDKLRMGDAEAWHHVRLRSVRMEMNRFRHSGMVRKWSLTEDELLDRLYEEMVCRGRLACYRGDGDIYGWLGRYVVGYIYRANPDRRREIPVGRAMPSESAVCDDSVTVRDDRRLVDRCLGLLWKKNPMRAYVHYLKLGAELSSLEICRFFGLSSPANVDQIFSRAVKSMRKLRAEHA